MYVRGSHFYWFVWRPTTPTESEQKINDTQTLRSEWWCCYIWGCGRILCFFLSSGCAINMCENPNTGLCGFVLKWRRQRNGASKIPGFLEVGGGGSGLVSLYTCVYAKQPPPPNYLYIYTHVYQAHIVPREILQLYIHSHSHMHTFCRYFRAVELQRYMWSSLI